MKITKEQIEARIKGVEYEVTHGRLTFCIVTLDNGFLVTGQSCCVEVADFNEDTGRKMAYDDAFDQLWPYFGFLTKEDAFRQRQSEGDAVASEAYASFHIERLADFYQR